MKRTEAQYIYHSQSFAAWAHEQAI
jgi:hypothetical protein